jgi:Antitoxin SocA-like, Panacea domain
MADRDRLSSVTHYVIARCDPERLGAVKLNKVLWFADVLYYRRHGRTITGVDNYMKQQYGPVQRGMLGVLDELKRDGKIVERFGETPVGLRREYVWLKEPDLTGFTADEVDVLNEVMDWICDGESAKSISEKSHDVLWDETEIGAPMPVRAGAVVPAEITADAMEWAKTA